VPVLVGDRQAGDAADQLRRRGRRSAKDALDALFNQLVYVADLAIAQIMSPLVGSTGALSPSSQRRASPTTRWPIPSHTSLP